MISLKKQKENSVVPKSHERQGNLLLYMVNIVI